MAITSAGLGTQWSAAAMEYLTVLVTDDFQPRLNDARNNSAAILGLIPETSDRVSGKFIVEPVQFGRNGEAFAFVREGGKLPDPKTTKALPMMYRTRKLFARMLVHGDVMRASNKDDVAFIDAVERDFQAMSDDMAIDQARIWYGDGSGRVAEVLLNVDADTIDVRLPSSWEGVSTCTTLPTDNERIYVGQRLSILTPAGVHKCTRTVESIDAETVGPPSSARITFTANHAGTPAVGDWVCKAAFDLPDGAGNETSSSFRVEPMGLMGIYSDDGILDGNGVATLPAGALSYVGTDDFTGTSPDNFQGVPVAGNTWNQAIVMGNAGTQRPLTEGLLHMALSKIEQTNNGMIEFLLSSYGVRDAFGISLLGDKRYTNTTELKAGWSTLDWMGKTWYVDRHCPKNRLFFMGLERSGFRQHVNEPFQPLNPYGPHWYRLPDDDAYQCAFVMNYNVGVGIRQRTGGHMVDLSESSI